MKKLYETPELEIEKFSFPSNLITTSDGQGGADQEIDPWGDGNEF